MLEQLGDAGLPAQGRDPTSLRTSHHRIIERRDVLSEQEGANGFWPLAKCHHWTSRWVPSASVGA